MIDIELSEGDLFGPLETFETPGHAADHLSFLAGSVLFCGDTVLGEGSVFVPPGGGSMTAYLASLRKLQTLDLAALCPGHGPVVGDPAGEADSSTSIIASIANVASLRRSSVACAPPRISSMPSGATLRPSCVRLRR